MRRDIAIGLVLAAAIAAVYWPVVGHEFLSYDDDSYVASNRHVLDGLTREDVGWAFTSTERSNWHPLTWLSLQADATVFHKWAGGYHLHNLLLHIASAVLLYLVLKRMTRAVWPSAVVAALFGLHPLHVESVAWVAERKDVLSTLFWMLTMGAYVLYVERPGRGRYAWVFVLLALGLMAKPMLVTLPLVLLLLDFWPLGRLKAAPLAATKGAPRPSFWSTAGRLVKEKAPLLALVAVSCVITYAVQQKGGAVVPTKVFPLADRVVNAVVAYVAYLGNTFWPTDMAVFYPAAGSVPREKFAWSAAVLVGVTAGVLGEIRRRPYLAVGWFWFLGTLVPVIGLVQVGGQSMADRYTYVPLVGVFVGVAWAAWDLAAAWAHWMKALVLGPAAAAAVVACGAVAFAQVGYWHDSEKLFRHALDVTSNNGVAHYNLANVLAARNEMTGAIEQYGNALRVWPQFARAHNNLAAALITQHRMDDALRELRTALEIAPRMAEVQTNLNYLQGLLRRELQVNPNNARAFAYLAVVSAEMDRWPDAIALAQEAARLAPDQPEALANLALVLATAPDEKLRDGPKAVRLAEQACDMTSRRNPALMEALAAAYANAGRFPEAVKTAEEALALAGQDNSLATELSARLVDFRAGRPWRMGRAAAGPAVESAAGGELR